MHAAARSQRAEMRCSGCTSQPTDDLTGLLPRGAFMQALSLSGPGVCLLMLDLDRFKAVNDQLGHAAGDALLRHAAARLAGAVRAGDLVARLGGDEFALLLAAPIDARAARRLARRLVDLLSQPYAIDGRLAHVGASVGAALAGEEGQAADALLAQADMALYAAKAAGRGCARLFGQAMRAATDAALALRVDLMQALPRGELALYYQPLLNVAENRIEGFEALPRWNHPTQGLVAPVRFLPLAEQLGLMPAIGEWALRQGCAEAMQWRDGQRLSLGVSAGQFRNGRFPAMVAQVLAEIGLDPARLELDVPERALAQATETGLLRQMEALRSLGVSLALDEFGTGHSSLAQLSGLPVQRLKIAHSFAGDRNMLRAVLGLGGALGLQTMAEGVENAAQLALVREQGCTGAQGLWISRPLPHGQLWSVSAPPLIKSYAMVAG